MFAKKVMDWHRKQCTRFWPLCEKKSNRHARARTHAHAQTILQIIVAVSAVMHYVQILWWKLCSLRVNEQNFIMGCPVIRGLRRVLSGG
jgi:hypothetical protein